MRSGGESIHIFLENDDDNDDDDEGEEELVSIWSTSRIVGLCIGSSARQWSATLRTSIIWVMITLGSRFESGLMRGSMTSINPSLLCNFIRTHWAMSMASPNSGSKGRRPVTSSNNTTPKLYMSLFSSTFNVYTYSGNPKIYLSLFNISRILGYRFFF